MNTPSRRLPKAQRREQLLDVALDLVREEGTDALTLARVAERAGVSVGTLYQYFPNRESVAAALVLRAMERLLAEMRRAL